VLAALRSSPSFLSIISYWEVMIKSRKGLLDVGDPRLWWAETLDSLLLKPLLFRPEHITAIYDLPPIHQDPFDHALIAQAIAEDLTFLTTDARVALYASEHLRVIR
jgi:PIN domain nuclease of toxin-antitoxin system